MADHELLQDLQEADKASFLDPPDEKVSVLEGGTRNGLFFHTRDNFRRFEDAVRQIVYSKEANGLSFIAVDRIVVDILVRTKRAGGTIGLGEVKELKNAFAEVPKSTHHVVKELRGVHLRGHSKPYELAGFTIYHWPDHKHLIVGRPVKDLSRIWPRDNYRYMIGCKVQARDSNEAQAKADILFTRFENAIRFLVGHYDSSYDVRIGSPHASGFEDSFVFHEDQTTSTTGLAGIVQELPIDDAYFLDATRGYDRLLNLLAYPDKSVHKRIVRSVEWIGQALSDKSPASAIIKAATALEVLFAYDEKRTINAGIMAQISESCAHVLGNSPEQAVELERTVKRLYGERSAAAHGGKEEVSIADVKTLIRYVRRAIEILLTHPDLSQLDTIEKLAEHFRLRKYGWMTKPHSGENTAPPSASPNVATGERLEVPRQRYAGQILPEKDADKGPFAHAPTAPPLPDEVG